MNDFRNLPLFEYWTLISFIIFFIFLFASLFSYFYTKRVNKVIVMPKILGSWNLAFKNNELNKFRNTNNGIHVLNFLLNEKFKTNCLIQKKKLFFKHFVFNPEKKILLVNESIFERSSNSTIIFSLIIFWILNMYFEKKYFKFYFYYNFRKIIYLFAILITTIIVLVNLQVTLLIHKHLKIESFNLFLIFIFSITFIFNLYMLFEYLFFMNLFYLSRNKTAKQVYYLVDSKNEANQMNKLFNIYSQNISSLLFERKIHPFIIFFNNWRKWRNNVV